MGFLTRQILPNGRNPTFEEWMIGCVASRQQDYEVVYYVSRGLYPNDILVFTETGDGRQVTPFDYYGKVGVADVEAIGRRVH